MYEADLIRMHIMDTHGSHVTIAVPPDFMKMLKGDLHSVSVEVNTVEIVRVNGLGKSIYNARSE